MSKWYAITTSPAAERRVRTSLTEHGVEAYYPVERVWRTRPGRRTTAERPFIRGYVFARTADHAALVALTHDIEGAGRVHMFRGPRLNGQSADESAAAFIEELREAEASGDFDATLPRDRAGRIVRALEPGAAVRLKSGPLKGFAGKLVKLGEKRRAQIVLAMLGGEVAMTVDLLKLEAA